MKYAIIYNYGNSDVGKEELCAANLAIRHNWQLDDIERPTEHAVVQYLAMGHKHAKLKTSQKVEIFSRVSFFQQLAEVDLKELSKLFKCKGYSSGEVIMTQGSYANEFFIVASGQAQLSAASDSGEQQVISTKSIGEYFGELSIVMENSTNPTEVRAVDTLICMTLAQHVFQQHSESPYFRVMKFIIQSFTSKQLVPLLSKIPFLSGLDATKLSVLTELLQYQGVPKGTVLCREGQRGDTMYIICEGSVQIVAEGDRDADVECEGFLLKRGSKVPTWKRRYCVLKNNQVEYYQAVEDEAGTAAEVEQRLITKGSRPDRLRAKSAVVSSRNVLAGQGGSSPGSGTPSGRRLSSRSVMISELQRRRRRVSLVGNRAAAERQLKGGFVIQKVDVQIDRPNRFKVNTEDGRVWLAEAETEADRNEWVKCIRAGIERARCRRGGKRSGMTQMAGMSRSLLVTELGPGNYFGEIAVVADIPRTATVTTMSDKNSILSLDRAHFQGFLKLVPKMRAKIESMARQRSAQSLRALHLPFLAGFTEAKLSSIADVCRLVGFKAGDVVFRQGDVGDCFYIILHGHMSVIVTDESGESMTVNELTAGCYFGEIALLTDAPRLATVRAEENCSVMEISRQHFLTMFANQSKSAVADFELKLFRHNCELHHVIHHRRGIECFTDALKKEFSAENIEFWKAAEDFRANFDPADEKNMEKVKEIWDKFIDDSSPTQINIKSNIREVIEQDMKEGHVTADTLLGAQAEIYMLMDRDNFARFKRSEAFANLLVEIDPYRTAAELKAEMKADVNTSAAAASAAAPANANVDSVAALPPRPGQVNPASHEDRRQSVDIAAARAAMKKRASEKQLSSSTTAHLVRNTTASLARAKARQQMEAGGSSSRQSPATSIDEHDREHSPSPEPEAASPESRSSPPTRKSTLSPGGYEHAASSPEDVGEYGEEEGGEEAQPSEEWDARSEWSSDPDEEEYEYEGEGGEDGGEEFDVEAEGEAYEDAEGEGYDDADDRFEAEADSDPGWDDDHLPEHSEHAAV